METHFAPGTVSSPRKLDEDVQRISQNPVVDGLLHMAGGTIAVLNENRQLVAINDLFRKLRHNPTLTDTLGLRFGEFVGCMNTPDTPSGCGTGQFCSSCGAAVAMVTSLEENRSSLEKCAVHIKGNGKGQDLFLQVQSSPIVIGDSPYILLLLNDITRQQKWASLEKVFFHDVNNELNNLLQTSELLVEDDGKDGRELAKKIAKMSRRLADEVSMHRQLFQSNSMAYTPVPTMVSVSDIFAEIHGLFSNKAQQANVTLAIEKDIPDTAVNVDFSLLFRVLSNMLTNAIEASPAGSIVKVWVLSPPGKVVFQVWNEGRIPPEIARRIFRRNVSTKPGIGRGVGTYSMKLFGEEILGGKVDFTTTAHKGTTFRFSLDL